MLKQIFRKLRKKYVKKISVFGLGKVGITLAAVLADSGYEVIGVDIDEKVINGINSGNVKTSEPGVRKRVKKSSGHNLKATNNTREAVLETDLSFIIVPTPSNASGGFSLRYVKRVCEEIGKALKDKKSYHTVSMMSTVFPSSSENIIIPLLEDASGKKLGEGFGYTYNPAFIALGEIVKGFLEPDFVLIGESDKKSGKIVESVHLKMLHRRSPVARMNTIEAEITKLASNTHETMRVSFANMLFSLCTELSGANVDKITHAIAYRVGKRFFKGAAPYGGPCWPRDNVALAALMDAAGVSNKIPRSVHEFNIEHGKYIFEKILKLTNRGDTVGILGLSYKPGTPVIEHSFGLKLSKQLAYEGRHVIAWDPLAIDEARLALGDKIDYADSGNECVRRSRLIVITNAMKELEKINWGAIDGQIVVDCWRCLASKETDKIKKYIPLGHGSAYCANKPKKKMNIERLKLLTE